MKKLLGLAGALAAMAFGASSLCAAVSLSVQQRTPERNSATAGVGDTIFVRYNLPLDITTVNSSTVIVRGSQTGPLYSASYSLLPGNDSVLVIDPATDFKPGEEITVTLTTGIESNDHRPLDDPYSWSFRAASASATVGDFQQYLMQKNNRVSLLMIADLNGDGLNDFAAPESLAFQLYVAENTGNSTFSDSTFPVPFAGYGILGIFGNMNNDSYLDVVGVDNNYTDLTVTYGTGSGFGPDSLFSFGRMSYMQDMQLADYNGDGNLDVSMISDTTIHFMVRSGSSFVYSSTATSGYISSHVSGDFNNDGSTDIIAVSNNEEEMWLFENVGDGSVFLGGTWLTGVLPSGSKLYKADIDQDGDLDVVIGTVSHLENVPLVFFQDGGDFILATSNNLSEAWSRVFPTDLDGDGKTDLVGVKSMPGDTATAVVVAINEGSGIFATSATIAVLPFYNPYELELSAGDLNGDGKTDVLVSSNLPTSPTYVLFSGAPAGVVTNTNNSGPGSLRYALENATSGSVITFADGITPHFTITGGPIRIQSLLNVDFSNLGGITIEAVGGGPAIVFSCDAVGTQLRNATVLGTVVSDCSEVRPVYIQNTNSR